MNGYDEQEYIRNQNLLSDIEQITLSSNSASPTVMDYDGFLMIKSFGTGTASMNAEVTVHINGYDFATISIYATTTTNAKCAIPFRVNKGDSIYITWSGNGSLLTNYGRFYKLRDYSNR